MASAPPIRPRPLRRGARLFPHSTEAVRIARPRPLHARLARALLMTLCYLALGLYAAYRYGAASPQIYGPDWDRSGYGGAR